MRSHHVTAGLFLLLIAGALGLHSLREPPQPEPTARATRPHASPVTGPKRAHDSLAGTARPAHPAHHHRVEPLPPADADDLAQARQTEAAARRRLAELTEHLALSERQQDRIFPLLVRASPHYDESLRLAGHPHHPGAPLSRAAADELLHGLLDPYQQVEFELLEAEKELWWSDVISRLEQDLRDSTQPDQLPAAPPPHGGGNLFDQLGGDTP